MVPAALRRLGTLGLIALWVLVTGGLLLLLALSVQNSMQFSRLQGWILLANVIALIAVSVLLARKLIELVRAFRAGVPGSRLTARTVAIFGSLVVAPLIIVYLFSLEFLNQGIDSWFKVEIKQGLTDALDLSKSAMDVRMREYARFVMAQYPVPPQLSRLSEAVQHSYSQHYNLTQQREGVKNLFGMTLTLVLLLAMLTAI
jgi:nitrogen fixation/metabolism regulation signal transduction histidine kinase